MTSVLIKRGNLDTEFGHAQKKDNVKRHMEKTAIYEPKNARDDQKLGEKPGTDYFLEPSEGALPCQYLYFGLLNSIIYCETINFCYSKPPSLWCFLMAAPENEYTL